MRYARIRSTQASTASATTLVTVDLFEQGVAAALRIGVAEVEIEGALDHDTHLKWRVAAKLVADGLIGPDDRMLGLGELI